MKKIVLILCLGFLNFSVSAQSEKEIISTIKSVTVYQEGAQISRTASPFLAKGKTTLLFSNLSADIDPKSIQAKGTKGITIVSVSQSIDFINKAKVSPKIEKLENRKKAIRDSLLFIKGVRNVYLQEKNMILTNKSIGGNDGVSISELQNAASFFRSRLLEIETKHRELKQTKYMLNMEFIGIAKQLLELNAKSDLPTSSIKVVIASENGAKSTIDLKYIVMQAGWIPNYDIRISDVSKPMNLFYKAKVFQNSGEDWNDVSLTLSTGNPSVSNNKPTLEGYYFSYSSYNTHNNNSRETASNRTANLYSASNGTIGGRITDNVGESLPGVSVVVKGTTTGTVTDIDGFYKLSSPIENNVLVYSFVGYKAQEFALSPNQQIANIVLTEDTETLDEVVVTAIGIKQSTRALGYSVQTISGDELNGYFGAASYGSYNKKRTKKKEKAKAVFKPSKKTTHIPLAINKRQTSTEFKIKIPYTIPSDDHEYDVTMVEYEVNANYSYSAVPKLSEDAFLTAKIPDWTQYNMLSGNVNLFFKGVFQGESFLDLKSFEDTLTISVGRDSDIAIKRELQKDFSSTRLLGNFKKELKTWEITIKNNKDNAISINIEDEFPVSRINEIKVEQIESSDAKLDKDSGKLSWDLKLKAKEKKTLIIKYSVKYPKYRKIVVD